VKPLLRITSVPEYGYPILCVVRKFAGTATHLGRKTTWLSEPSILNTPATTRQSRNPNKCQPPFNNLCRSHSPPMVIESTFNRARPYTPTSLILPHPHPRSSPLLHIYPILCLEQVVYFLGWVLLAFLLRVLLLLGGCCYWFGGGIHTSRFRKDARAICVLQIAGTRA
jgi:hypothetical protein